RRRQRVELQRMLAARQRLLVRRARDRAVGGAVAPVGAVALLPDPDFRRRILRCVSHVGRMSLGCCRMDIVARSVSRSEAGYCGSIPASLTTLAHFSISAGMNLASSSGVLVRGVMPSPLRRSCTSGRLRYGIIAPFSLSTIGRGVPARATTEN